MKHNARGTNCNFRTRKKHPEGYNLESVIERRYYKKGKVCFPFQALMLPTTKPQHAQVRAMGNTFEIVRKFSSWIKQTKPTCSFYRNIFPTKRKQNQIPVWGSSTQLMCSILCRIPTLLSFVVTLIIDCVYETDPILIT